MIHFERTQEMKGRRTMNIIYFKGNPWAEGHRILQFEWSGHLSEKGLHFDFEVLTAPYDEADQNSLEDEELYDYDEEDEDEDEELYDEEDENENEELYEDEEDDDEDIDDWDSKTVWRNYNSFHLTSEDEEQQGLLIGSKECPFNEKTLTTTEWQVDFLTEEQMEYLDPEELSFSIYLLGHDSAAFHTIVFSQNQDCTYAIQWDGKIALTYAGQEEFQYEFYMKIDSATFEGFTIPSHMTDEAALALVKQYTVHPENFYIVNKKDQRLLVWA